MRPTRLLIPLVSLLCLASSPVWAIRDCTFNNSAPTKSKICELLETEEGLVTNLGDVVDSVCDGMSNEGCGRAKDRVAKLHKANQRAHGENDALLEDDFTELFEGAYKGKGKMKQDGSKTCTSKDVDEEALLEFLDDLGGSEGIQDPGTNLEESVEYFSARDQDNAIDPKCNNWKVRVIDETGERDGVIRVSERQEGLCPTKCKGKDQEVENKRQRFDEEIGEALEEMQGASEELALQSQYLRAQARSLTADPEKSCPPRPGAIINVPIHTAIVMPTYIAMKAMEISTEVCKHPANQDVLGNNAASACTPLEVGYRIAKEAYDLMVFMNDDYQSAQIAFIETCVDKMGDDIAEIKEIVKEIRGLVITPQGQRASGDIVWPNK
jgi:hypothetical protein